MKTHHLLFIILLSLLVAGAAFSQATTKIRVKVKSYTEEFNGTTNRQFTVAKTPIASSVEVYVNGTKLWNTHYTLTVKKVKIKAGLGWAQSTDISDIIKITYQSTF